MTRTSTLIAAALASACAGPALVATAQPVNDACAAATPVAAGTPVIGTVVGAAADGDSWCNLEPTPDVFHAFTTGVGGTHTFSLCTGTMWDTVISLHTGCPADLTTLIACDDEACRPVGAGGFGYASSLTIDLPANTAYLLRIAGYDQFAAGDVYELNVIAPAAPTGACCVLGSCGSATAAGCLAVGGAYRGDYTSCTLAAGASVAASPAVSPGAIPDYSVAGLESTATIGEAFAVGDVRLELQISHTFVGDLTATLTHDGVTAVLFERLGGNETGDDSNLQGLYSLGDSGSQTLWVGATGAAGTSSVITPTLYRAVDRYANTVSLRSAFVGLPAAGAWTLRIADTAAFDTGTLVSWRLLVDRAAGDSCQTNLGACCIGTTCTMLSPAGCVGPNRRFTGIATGCNAAGNTQFPCCVADFSQSGGVTLQDLFDFLSAYFAADLAADINGGGITVQDIFDYLSAYFGGC